MYVLLAFLLADKSFPILCASWHQIVAAVQPQLIHTAGPDGFASLICFMGSHSPSRGPTLPDQSVLLLSSTLPDRIAAWPTLLEQPMLEQQPPKQPEPDRTALFLSPELLLIQVRCRLIWPSHLMLGWQICWGSLMMLATRQRFSLHC